MMGIRVKMRDFVPWFCRSGVEAAARIAAQMLKINIEFSFLFLPYWSQA
jgi:hypothetical protein